MISDELAKILAPLIHAHPILWQSGGDVIEYIMLTSGNGYRWKEGENGYYPYCLRLDEEPTYYTEEDFRKAKIHLMRETTYYYDYGKHSLVYKESLPENIDPVWQEAIEVAWFIVEEYPSGRESRLNSDYEIARKRLEKAGDDLEKYYTPIIQDLLKNEEYDKALKHVRRCKDAVTSALMFDAIRFHRGDYDDKNKM